MDTSILVWALVLLFPSFTLTRMWILRLKDSKLEVPIREKQTNKKAKSDRTERIWDRHKP